MFSSRLYVSVFEFTCDLYHPLYNVSTAVALYQVSLHHDTCWVVVFVWTPRVYETFVHTTVRPGVSMGYILGQDLNNAPFETSLFC